MWIDVYLQSRKKTITSQKAKHTWPRSWLSERAWAHLGRSCGPGWGWSGPAGPRRSPCPPLGGDRHEFLLFWDEPKSKRLSTWFAQCACTCRLCILSKENKMDSRHEVKFMYISGQEYITEVMTAKHKKTPFSSGDVNPARSGLLTKDSSPAARAPLSITSCRNPHLPTTRGDVGGGGSLYVYPDILQPGSGLQ